MEATFLANISDKKIFFLALNPGIHRSAAAAVKGREQPRGKVKIPLCNSM